MEVKSKVGLFIFFGLMYGAGRAMAGAHSALHEAARTGNLADVQWLVNVGVPVDTAENGLTALHSAAEKGHVEVARLLIDAGANVNAANRDGTTPLHFAAANGNANVAQLLLQSGAIVSVTNKKSATDDESASDDEDRNTPLNEAACNNHWNLVKLLIDYGANVNAANRDGTTPLHHAASLEDVEGAQLLIDAGADVNARDEMGQAVLHYAAGCIGEPRPATARLLLDHGARVNVVDRDGRTPLHYAANSCYSNTIGPRLEMVARFAQILVERDANISEAYHDDEEVSLICAIKKGHEWFAQILVERGEDVMAKDRQGQPALDLCTDRWRRELQRISDARQNSVQLWGTQLECELPADVVRGVILPLALPSRAAQEVIRRMGSRIRPGAQASDSRPRKKQRHL